MALTNEQNYVIDSVLCSDDGKVIAVNSILLMDKLEKIIY